MLQRRMTLGESFDYHHPGTGEFLARVWVKEIRRGGEVVLGIEAPEGVDIIATESADLELDPGHSPETLPT